MSIRNLVFVFVLLLGAMSCKHQQATTQTNEPKPFNNTHAAGGETGMTPMKANEEETFVQGCIEKSLGNSRKALVQFQECLNMDPKSAAANYEVAGIYAEMGQPDRALKYAQAAVEFAPENRWYKLRYADLLQQNNQHEQAVKIFKDLSDAEPKNVDLLFRYASSLSKAGNPDEALKAYDRIEAIEGISDTLQSCRIGVYEKQKDIVGEENALKALVKAFPDQFSYEKRLADFYYSISQPEKAAEVFKKMTADFPEMVGPHLLLAGYYNSINQDDKAFPEAERAFEISEAGSLDSKISYLKTFYPCTDSSATLSPVKRKGADSLCRILRRIYPDQAAPFTISGDYLFRDGKYKEARDMYHKAAVLGQDEYASWKRLMEINNKLNDNVSQEKDCKAALELFPTQSEPYYYLGLIQYNKKDYSHAIDNLESAKDYLGDNPQRELELKTMLIDAYRNTDKNEKADEYTEDLIAKDTNNLPLIASYCASLSERKIKLYKAEQLMLKLVQKEPSNASYLETLGWVEYGMHDYKTANQYMALALLRTPDNARMNERMGDIQFHLGNTEDAMKYWNIARTKGGTNPALEKKISTKTLDENE
ncbi:MAG TPA: tetratricopeptide repeat protein [Bacteroidia bacterium]|nr:tetratricopeptide repeat protein [Bacteroidia bacterium]